MLPLKFLSRISVYIFLIFGPISVFSTQNYYYDKGVVDTISHCPGRYCGRTFLSNGSWSACGACERGLRRNSSSACQTCTDEPTFYDWFYLGFMGLLPLIFHLICIDNSSRRRRLSKEVLILYAIATIEVVISAVVTLMLFDPKGSIKLRSCRVTQMADWYPLMHNPNPNYEGLLYCTQEAVYPLYSIVFAFYTMCLIVMLIVRSWLSNRLIPKRGKMAVYSGLYFLPALMICHALFGGIIYYSFPYIVIIMSVISNAVFFAYQLDQSMNYLFLETLKNCRSLIILLLHWFLHAYGIIAVTQLEYPSLLLLIPIPSLFYILTSKFSDPSLFS